MCSILLTSTQTIGAKVTEEIDLIKPHHQTTISACSYLILGHWALFFFEKTMSTGGKSFRLRGDLIGRSVPCRCEGFMPTSLARQLCTWADEKIERRRRGGGTETSPPPRFSDPTRKNKERKLKAPLPPEAAQRHPVRRRRAPAETTTKRIVQRSVAERAGTGNSARRTTISTSASSVNRLGANQNVTIMIFELRC